MEASGAIVAGTLVTPRGTTGMRGSDLARPHVLSPGAVVWREGVITYVGEPVGMPAGSPAPEHHPDATLIPGFVDAHTHLPFIGWRDDEFEARLAGTTYRDLHGRGGGIARSARMLAEASDDAVLSFSRPLLDEMIASGTTTLEMKTGYGLSVTAEMRQARLARALARDGRIATSVTLLAGHAIPEGMTRADWIRLACDELIPDAAARGIVDTVDIYVEDIAFTLEDLETVAAAAAAADLPLRCHADQLGDSGAAAAAARLGARSADHLNHVSPEGVTALAASDTVALLLPASTFMLRGRPAPARALVEAGAIVALSTDANPGTSPVLSMPETIAMACGLYGLTPDEALTASTLNAAAALGLSAVTGSIEVGKRADLVVLDAPSFRHVPYRPGHAPVVRTIAGGRTVARRA